MLIKFSAFSLDSLMPRGEELLPYKGYIAMCGPNGNGFLAVLVINSVSILAIFVINRVWFLHSCLQLGMFLEEVTFLSLSIKLATKALRDA